MEFTLLWAALSGAGALYGALWWMGRRDARLCVRDLWEIALTAALVGLAVGRLVAIARSGVNPFSHPGDLILVRAGVDTVAATAGSLATAAWMARRTRFEQLDGLAPAALFGVAGWHAGCVFRGACLGTPASLPWAWGQPGSEITRHPVELYTALLLAMAAWALFRLWLRDPPAGMVTGLALAAAGLSRLATEPIRPALLAGPVWWYAAAAVIGGGLAGWSLRFGRSAGTLPGPSPLQ